MGAGLYPLDYLIIIHQNKVHCKIPSNLITTRPILSISRLLEGCQDILNLVLI